MAFFDFLGGLFGSSKRKKMFGDSGQSFASNYNGRQPYYFDEFDRLDYEKDDVNFEDDYRDLDGYEDDVEDEEYDEGADEDDDGYEDENDVDDWELELAPEDFESADEYRSYADNMHEEYMRRERFEALNDDDDDVESRYDFDEPRCDDYGFDKDFDSYDRYDNDYDRDDF